jgi:hypothetical protein
VKLRAAELDYQCVYLDVSTENTRATRFDQKHGFFFIDKRGPARQPSPYPSTDDGMVRMNFTSSSLSSCSLGSEDMYVTTSHIQDSAFFKPDAPAALPTQLWKLRLEN